MRKLLTLMLVLMLSMVVGTSVVLATGGQYQKNTGCHNSKKIGFHCHDKKGNIIQNKKAKKPERRGASKECERWLRWFSSETRGSDGGYIEKNLWGHTVVHPDSVSDLVKACRK